MLQLAGRQEDELDHEAHSGAGCLLELGDIQAVDAEIDAMMQADKKCGNLSIYRYNGISRSCSPSERVVSRRPSGWPSKTAFSQRTADEGPAGVFGS